MRRYTDCIVPEGGYPTRDDYLRVLAKPRKEGGRLTMLHRLEWEKVNGPIPEGYEVDHRCKNRGCQNVNHMQLLTTSHHKSKDNEQRYLLRTLKILLWIKNNPGYKPKEVAHQLGIPRGRVEELSRSYPEVRKYLDMKQIKDRALTP
jgi:predicted XRE-type DNA-binding protein